MRRCAAAMIAMALILLFLGHPSRAAVIVRESFDTIPSGGYGTIVDVGTDRGWTADMVGDLPENGAFFSLPVSTLNADEGTIVLELVRQERENMETLFLLKDRDDQELFSVYLYWEGFYDTGRPAVVFHGKHRGVLYSDFSAPKRGNRPVLPSVVHLDDIQPGEKFNLAITWGETKKKNALYLNGVEVPSLKRSGNLMKEAILNATDFYLGGWPYNENGSTVMLNSVLDELAIHDVAFNPLASIPVVNSVSHNAFSVAGYSGKLVNDDQFTVILTAEPGGRAAFDILRPPSTSRGVTTPEKIIISKHEMTEDIDKPGTYRGVHVVEYGEDVEEGQVVGRFTSAEGNEAEPLAAERNLTIDTRVYMEVRASNDLIPADENSRSGVTIAATDANGKVVRGHELKLTMSTTDEYTGTVGGGSFEDLVGSSLDVDWGGITDSFGEVSAQYVSGFAAKTVMVSAKDMVSGDVGVGWVRSYIDGTVDIVVTEPKASALAVAGSLDVSLSREWLTADGRSRSRLTAVVKDASGEALSGHDVRFTLLGDNGEIRVIQGKTDARGRALADYIAGIVMGQVQVEVRDLTSGMVVVAPIELRPDAPAEIILAADPGEVVTGVQSTVTAKVTDANGNPNASVDVLYNILAGEGSLGADKVATDEDGKASATFTAGKAGIVTLRGTVMSREPTAGEISAAEGAVFLYGLSEEPDRLEVAEWLVEPGDEVVQGQALVTLEDRRDNVYTVVAPRDGIVATFVAEERDRVKYGDTLGYVIEKPE